MREMKDSGQTWLGAIPAKWDQSTIGSLYTLRNEKVSDRDYPPLSVTMKGVVPQLDTAAKTDSHDDRKLVKKGDFAINSRSDRRGSCGISNYDGSVSLINTILTPREEMNPDYYNWVFHTAQFADEFYRWGHGIVDDLWTTRWQEMKNIVVAVPSLDEQELIAETISSEVTKVDALIANQEAQIEKLKQYKQSLITEVVTKGLDPDAPMKDSGVEWIGIIPAHWSIEKIKYATRVRDERYEQGDYPYIALENIESMSGRYIQTDSQYDLEGSRIARSGDVIFGKLRPYLAKVFEIHADTCVNGEFAVFGQRKLIANFTKYFMLNARFIEAVNSSTYGTKMPRANLDYIANLSIVVPTQDEQLKIVKYLDTKSRSIDDLIDIKKAKIERLNQYKKSLIYEYVTGKKEV